ncbi:uncharacterized protein [Drosophila bipectinata]|uniref:uncharacterized protein isoform X2 n=1 Tax=Drosophila bipectinata TaxID=42026 RepID=UPI001C89F044|nr:uncharacterized protein LOC108120683 [Drosophila bipectinata]
MSNFDPFSFLEDMRSFGHFNFNAPNGNFTGNSQYTPPPFNGSTEGVDFNNPLPSLTMLTPGPERGVFIMGTVPERMIPALSNLMREFQRFSFSPVGRQSTSMQAIVEPNPEDLSDSQPSGQLGQNVYDNSSWPIIPSFEESETVPICQSSGNSPNVYDNSSWPIIPSFEELETVPIYQSSGNSQRYLPSYGSQQAPQSQQQAQTQQQQQNYRAGGTGTNAITGSTANGARVAANPPLSLEYYPTDPGYPQTSGPAEVLNLCDGIRKVDLKMIGVLHGENRKNRCEYCYDGSFRSIKLMVNGKGFQQKKMQCRFCWKQLPDWDQYGDHLAKCEPVKMPYGCCLCPFKAMTRAELEDHFLNCDGDDI